MVDKKSFLELYRRAIAAMDELWDAVMAVVCHVRLPFAENGDASPCATWNIKGLSGRMMAKAAKNGGFHKITDVLRASIVFGTAEQLEMGCGFLKTRYRSCVKWFDNRLGDESAKRMSGYRDVLVLLRFSGHVCEVQLHLKVMHDQKHNGHEIYAVIRLLNESAATAENKYEGETNAAGKRHGKGTMMYPSGDVYVGDWRDGKRTGQGKYSYADGAVYEGGYVDGNMHGEGKYTFADGDAFRGVWSEGKETREREWL
jgi:hypothetical protein